MRYPWIQQHRDTFPVAAMCRVLEVSDSGYYEWQRRKSSPRSKRPHDESMPGVPRVVVADS